MNLFYLYLMGGPFFAVFLCSQIATSHRGRGLKPGHDTS